MARADQDKGEPKPPTPFLFIPYTPTDTGLRPLGGGIPSWLCPGIHFSGMPFTGAPLVPGTPVNVSVLVANSGALDAMVVASIYWADPSVAFSPTNLNLIGQQVFLVGATSKVESPVILWTPPPNIASHVCLLAEVTCTLDPSPGNFDVVNDRHYGQQNVTVLVAQRGCMKPFQFFVGNPARGTGRFRIRIRSVGVETLGYLRDFYNAESAELDIGTLELQHVEPGIRQKATQAFTLKLEPHQRRLCQVMIPIPQDLESNRFLAFEVEQSVEAVEGEHYSAGQSLGTIGVVIFAQHEL